MNDTAKTTETITTPAGPADDRQRAYLRNMMDRTEQITRHLGQIIATANQEIATMATGAAYDAGRGMSIIRNAGEIAALRAELTTMARHARGYGLTAEQAAYAIHLGATQDSLMDEGAAAWLYQEAPAR